MIPVDQTTFGVPGGNCQSAALASILELPLEDVPHFASGDDHSADTMWANMAKWLELRGLYPINFLWEDIACRPSAHYLLFGQSKSGPHCVVAKGHEIVHDPNPARSGLLTREQAVILVPFNPASWKTSLSPETVSRILQESLRKAMAEMVRAPETAEVHVNVVDGHRFDAQVQVRLDPDEAVNVQEIVNQECVRIASMMSRIGSR